MAFRMTAALMTGIAVLSITGCAARSKQTPPPATAATTTPAAPAPAATETPAPRSDVAQVALDPVFFGYDSHTLDPTAKATLDRIARAIRENGAMQITIEGHCDERGTVEYNLALGERRAQAVRDYLATAGVPANRMQTISYGKERPFANGSDERSWAQNRRAHFVER